MPVTLNLAAETDRVRQLALLTDADPGRLGGVRTFRGTRVPVRALFDHLRAGDPLEVFLEDFPGVTREQAEGVIDLASEGLLSEASTQ